MGVYTEVYTENQKDVNEKNNPPPFFPFVEEKVLRKVTDPEGRVLKLATSGRRFPAMYSPSYCTRASASAALAGRVTFQPNL